MKKLVTLCFVIFGIISIVTAQDLKSDGLKFTNTKEIKATPVRDQYRAGTCWSYSAMAFLESELLRLNKSEYNLSEMYVVRMAYEEKGIKYVRMHGNINFGGGGAFHDVTNMIKIYGIMPEEAYPGLNYGQDNHVHGEIDAVLKAFLDAVIKDENKTLTTAWLPAYRAILDAYFGPVPKTFKANGKEYTPISYAKDLGLNLDDYICITSFSHHPFYSPFILEIPDNWAWDVSYNLPLDEMMQVLYYAIDNGYSFAWGSDVSEKGFSFKNGVAIIPETDIKAMNGLEREKWEKLTTKEREKELFSFEKKVPEKIITQDNRQLAFDNYQTTDDHGMQITGTATDQFGTKYFLVKNSWNTNSVYKGYFYASDTFVRYKTTDIMINKKSIPKEILTKLKIQ